MTVPVPHPADDPTTALLAAAHDPDALAQLAEREQPALAAWLSRVLRDEDLAQEALQETWLVLSSGQWRFAVRTADPAGDLQAWLRQIGLRAALRLRTRQRTYRRHLRRWRPEPIPEPPTPLELLAEEDGQALLWALVCELPLAMREAVELRFRHGLDFGAIGRAQRCSALTARVRTWRALARMRRRLLLLGLLPTSEKLLLEPTLSSGHGGMVRLGIGGPGSPRGARAGAGPRPPDCPRVRLLHAAAAAALVLVGLFAWRGISEPAPGRSAHGAVGGALTLGGLQAQVPRQHRSTPAWEYIDRPDQEYLPRPRPRPPGPSSPDSGMEVSAEILVFHQGGLHLPFLGDRPTLLSRTQAQGLQAQVAGLDSDQVLSHTTLICYQGCPGWCSTTMETAFVHGYRLIQGVPNARNAICTTGLVSMLEPVIEGGGIRLRQAQCGLAELLDLSQHSARIPGAAPGSPDTACEWQEPTVRNQRSVALPTGGTLVPSGESLLLPAADAVILHDAPGGVDSAPAAVEATPSWWMLISPTEVPSGTAVETQRPRAPG